MTRGRGRAGAVVVLLGLMAGLAGHAAGQSPLVAELDIAAQAYHQDPARLDRVRDGLQQVAAGTPTGEDLIALSRAEFIWGEVRATTQAEKLGAYSRGREAGKRAVAARPGSALAHLWYGINIGRLGQTRGILSSLALLPSLKEEIRITLELDPRLPAAYSLAGNVFFEVPRAFGGDVKKAEEMFRKGLEVDPRFTSLRVGLAHVLIRQGRPEEARREVQAVLDEKAPRNVADWTVKDTRNARELLATLGGR